VPVALALAAQHIRLRYLTRALLVATILASRPDPARAQTVDSTLWATDGAVLATVRSGGTIYLGGGFTSVFPVTGGGAALSATTASPASPFPRIAGSVSTAVPDGAGGWFIGGHFTSVGSVPRNNIARVLADGTVSAWNPNANGDVLTLALQGSSLFVGGSFTGIGGQTRNHVGALAVATGLATAWNPNADYGVTVLVASGPTIYAGGKFGTIGGKSRLFLAALDAATGAATTWNPDPNDEVSTLIVNGSTVYAGGRFTSIGGQTRNFLAALSTTTGAASGWTPEPNMWITALALSGSTVYAGGGFLSVGGQPRNYLAAIDATTGAATPWNPNADDFVYALAVSGSTIYAGGYFNNIGGQPRNSIAALDATTGSATSWDPDAGGVSNDVWAICVSGSTIYTGGDFEHIGGKRRSNLAALDASTGAATAWNPGADGQVRALTASAATVYAGGYFAGIGGQSRQRVAALDAVTGLATSWNPGADGPVHTLALSGQVLYAGGEFGAIGGQSRHNIAALDLATGAATAWRPDANGSFSKVNAILLDGTKVYACGEFSDIGGQPRDNIAALDAATGAATAWDPNALDNIEYQQLCLAVSGSTVYTGGYGGCASIDAITGDIHWQTYGGVHGLAANSTAVYVCGEGLGLSPTCLAALDPVNGAVTSWNSGADRITHCLHLSGTTLYAGGQFTTIGGGPRIGFAAFSMPGTLSVPFPVSTSVFSLTSAPNPARAHTVLHFVLPAPGRANLAVFDLAGRRLATPLEGVLMTAGSHEVTLGTDFLSAGLYFTRLEFGSRTTTSRLVVIR
jgi:trimeric autotransporter adhesin